MQKQFTKTVTNKAEATKAIKAMETLGMENPRIEATDELEDCSGETWFNGKWIEVSFYGNQNKGLYAESGKYAGESFIITESTRIRVVANIN